MIAVPRPADARVQTQTKGEGTVGIQHSHFAIKQLYISFTSFYKRFTKPSTKTCRFVGIETKMRK